MSHPLRPATAPLYVVRWLPADGRDAKHCYFRRDADARTFRDKLAADGWTAALFVTNTDWSVLS